MLEAVAIAEPVMQRIAEGCSAGPLLAVTSAAAYIDLDGFIASISVGHAPPLPNAIGVAPCPRFDWPACGQRIQLGPEGNDAPLQIWWNPARTPVRKLRLPIALPVDALAERGRGILVAKGIAADSDPASLAAALATAGVATAQSARGRAAIELLFEAVASRDAAVGARAAHLLLGSGTGLTPDGDDFLAATAAVVAAGAVDGTKIVAALVPTDIRIRTTRLSATLIELAANRYVAEPLRATLDLAAPWRSWRRSLLRLEQLGATTGLTYAAAAGAVASLLGQHGRAAGQGRP